MGTYLSLLAKNFVQYLGHVRQDCNGPKVSSFFGIKEVFPQRSSEGNSPVNRTLLKSFVITGMFKDLNMPPSLPRGSFPAPADGRQFLTSSTVIPFCKSKRTRPTGVGLLSSALETWKFFPPIPLKTFRYFNVFEVG
uniref:Uncharacterized protein n=1 Tax=Lepeophtheirus salmonis TaxID=72036 RepID=A0A0K2UTC3_LEPSM